MPIAESSTPTWFVNVPKGLSKSKSLSCLDSNDPNSNPYFGKVCENTLKSAVTLKQRSQAFP